MTEDCWAEVKVEGRFEGEGISMQIGKAVYFEGVRGSSSDAGDRRASIWTSM